MHCSRTSICRHIWTYCTQQVGLFLTTINRPTTSSGWIRSEAAKWPHADIWHPTTGFCPPTTQHQTCLGRQQYGHFCPRHPQHLDDPRPNSALYCQDNWTTWGPAGWSPLCFCAFAIALAPVHADRVVAVEPYYTRLPYFSRSGPFTPFSFLFNG